MYQWKENRFVVVNVLGTIGYGKSHILAVLVLLLLKERIAMKRENGTEPFVCYIPDCQVLKLHGEMAIWRVMKENILSICQTMQVR